jgi:hypothetical protein
MEINKNGILKDEEKEIADLILSRVSAAPTSPHVEQFKTVEDSWWKHTQLI